MENITAIRRTFRVQIRQVILDLQNCKPEDRCVILGELGSFINVTRLGKATQCRILDKSDIEATPVATSEYRDVAKSVVALLLAKGIEPELVNGLVPPQEN